MIDEFFACICYESYLMRNTGTGTKLFLAKYFKDYIHIALFLKIKISVFHAKNVEFYVWSERLKFKLQKNVVSVECIY